MNVSIPAPIGGWNARDSVERMPPEDAIELINLVPSYQGVTARGGQRIVGAVATLGDATETLAAYEVGSTEKLIAAADGNFWDIDPTGTLTPTSMASGFTSDRWQYEHHSSRLIFVNGTDTEQVYNGTAFANLTISSGPTSGTLIGCRSFKGRMFYWEDDSLSFWYCEAGSFQGDMSEYDLSTFFKRGGKIVDMINWTRDAGEGEDDVAIFISSKGEALVFQGDDPGTLGHWELIGVFAIGEPLSPRGSSKMAADVALVTKDGYLPISVAMQTARVSELNNYSTPIIRAAKKAANIYSGNFGWECVFYPAESWFIVNVPLLDVDGSVQAEQHVMNTNTGRWCKFRGWDAITFCVFQNNLFFGSESGVHRANYFTDDDGEMIQYTGVTAFQGMGAPERRKQLTSAAIVSDYVQTPSIKLTGLTDFYVPNLGEFLVPPEETESEWDTSDWDEHEWASEEGVFSQRTGQLWQPVTAFGYQLALAVQFQSQNQRPTWYSSKMKFKVGKTV